MTSLLRTADGRLRALWRILLFLAAAIVCAVPAMFVATLLPAPFDESVWAEALESLLSALVVLAATAYMLRRVERASWDYVWSGRRALAPRALLFGGALGLLPIALPSLALMAAGWLVVAPQQDGSSLAAAGMAAVRLAPAAWFEELLIRGYVLAVLYRTLGWTRAVVLTSVVFGVLHAWNPGATGQSIALVTLAGLYLGAVVAATHSLWAATVAHFAWNWTMAALLHAPVSGLGLPTPDYRTVDAGPDWATGGAWGPEGGAGAALGMLGTLAYLYARRRRSREET